MHIRLIAVGDRQPTWVHSAFSEYAGRLPRQWQFQVNTVATSRRDKNAHAAVDAEGRKVLTQVRPGELVVLLDERGREMSSKDLASRLNDWQAGGRDICFVIGGPDGVSDECRERAEFVWSLSMHTLPHGLARVLFVEQMYRAWSLLNGHPYHRE